MSEMSAPCLGGRSELGRAAAYAIAAVCLPQLVGLTRHDHLECPLGFTLTMLGHNWCIGDGRIAHELDRQGSIGLPVASGAHRLFSSPVRGRMG